MNSMWEQFKQELMEEAREQGLAQGIEQGLEQGLEQGIEQGIEKGKDNAYLSSIRGVMEKLSITAEKAMDVLAIPPSEWARYKAML